MAIKGRSMLVVLGIVVFGLVFASGMVSASDNFTVGISQLVEHPALDSSREGFITGLEESGFIEGENIEFTVENAQGDMSTAQTIAQKFQNENPDLVLAIATPAAQAAANVIKDIPVLITAVTDPEEAGLVENMDDPGGNLTGTTDMNPIHDQFSLIEDFMPEAESVGIIYNSGEVNSVVQKEIAEEAAEVIGVELVEATATDTSEVQLAASSLAGDVDAVYLPTDNTVASALPSILDSAHQEGIPVFASEGAMVEQGAVATKGIDYFELGRKTGQMAAEVLEGTEPSELAIAGADNLNISVNKSTAEELGLEIPEDVLQEAEQVIE